VIERILLVGANHRLLTFLMLALVTTVMAPGLLLLKVDTGLSSLISDADLDRQAYLRVSEEFGSDNRTIVYVRDARLWSLNRMQSLVRLQDSLAAIPEVDRVESILTVRTVRGSGKALDTRPLIDSGALTPQSIAQAREDALANPLIVGNYISEDGTATAMMLTIKPPGEQADYDELVHRVLQEAVDNEADSFEKLFQIGPSRINAELKDALLEDLLWLGPISAGLLSLTILLFLGSIFGALLPLFSAALALVWTFGAMGLAGIPLNILSAMLPSLVIVIGSTEDTHMIAAYFQGITKVGKGAVRIEASRWMMRKMGVPLFLTVFTTALGFGANIVSSIELIRDFAMASTFAIIANGVITIGLVPLILSVIGPRRSPLGSSGGKVPGFTGVLVRMFSFGRQKMAAPIMIFTAALCCFFVYQASKLHVTNDPFSYLKSDRSLIEDANKLQTDLAGVKVFFVVLEAEDDRAFLEPENIDKLVELQKFIKAQGVFDLSISVADHLALVNREFNGGEAEFFVTPRKRELAAQYLLFFHRRDMQGYLSHDLRRANILVRHNVSDSSTLNPHIAELKEFARRVAGAQMNAYVVGENLMINAAAESLIFAQAKSLGLLVLVIFVLMSIMFTSIKGGLVALVPSLVPIVMMFGVMGLLDIPLNPGTAMVAVIAVGIAIDGTIHLFSRYNELSRQSGDNEGAVHATVREEAIPVVAASIALALGFGVLLTSNFTIIAQFGALSAATMLFSVFANLLVTPIIMSRVRLVGLYEILAMNMDNAVLERSPLFQGMTNYQIRKAILISDTQSFMAGDYVIRQDTSGRSMYLVLSGRVEVLREDDGVARHIVELGAGTVLGEVGYVREIQRTAHVRAVTDVEALRFDFERMRQDLRYFPRIVAALNFNISRILGERLADTMGVQGARSDTD
jgi:uncharacterized protein